MAESVRDQSMLWGYPVEVWDLWGVRLLFWGALFGVGGLVVSAFSAYVLYRVAEVSQQALIVESKAGAERIAELNNDTARLTGDNLALQTVLLPRHIGLVGLNGPPPAMEWFAGLETFTGTQVEIQSVLDPEAENLAKEIAIILTMKGLHPFSVNESRTRMAPTQISNGINIWYPTGKPWTAAEPNQPWFAWNRLAEALATALTRAGLSRESAR
jgi:hypothetical protein